MKRFLIGMGIGLLALAIPATAMASIGVGVGTGRITVKQSIKSGSIYTLPSVIVFNTGTQTATYTMSVTLNQSQPQLKPNPAWFSFSPQQFTLRPGKAQTVIPSLHPPIKTKPGAYFGYLEAHPAQTVKQGATAVGVAAATKLSFSVKPSNFFLAVLYRFEALYQLYAPWSYLITILAVVVVVVRLARKYLHFDIRITKI